MSVRTDRLNPGFSLYCDLLRFLASFYVLLVHASFQKLGRGTLWQTGFYGPIAVMVFFVLSGYIIAYITATREASLTEYSAARLARLYSVVAPAVVLTWALDAAGMAYNPALYDMGRENMPLLQAGAALLFLSESWNAHVPLFCNSAYWTLPYEFWYYVLFGAAVFLSGKARIAAILIAALIAGPNILIMFPLWLSGVAAYRLTRRAPVGRWAGLVFAASFAVIALGIRGRITGMIPTMEGPFRPFAFTSSDYVIGAGIALNLYAAAGLQFRFLRPFKTAIRNTAAMTFTLYLFNLPIMYFVAAFLPAGVPGPARFAILAAAALLGSAVLAYFTENRKDALRNALLMLMRPGRQARPVPAKQATDKA